MDESLLIPLDSETKVAERPDDHKTELRLWLRMLTCTTLIESEVRKRLRDNFDITLPRFDLLAQLERAPNGMTLGELSQRMMVSNGNITGLVELGQEIEPRQGDVELVAQAAADLGLDQSRTGEKPEPQPQLGLVVVGPLGDLGLGVERDTGSLVHHGPSAPITSVVPVTAAALGEHR